MFIVKYVASLTGCGPESFKKSVDDSDEETASAFVSSLPTQTSETEDPSTVNATSNSLVNNEEDWDAEFEDWEAQGGFHSNIVFSEKK